MADWLLENDMTQYISVSVINYTKRYNKHVIVIILILLKNTSLQPNWLLFVYKKFSEEEMVNILNALLNLVPFQF